MSRDPEGDGDPLPQRALKQRERIQQLWLHERDLRHRREQQIHRLEAVVRRRSARGIVARAVGAVGRRVRPTPSSQPAMAPTAPAAGADVRRRVAIHIGPRTWEHAQTWGDLPFGRSLQRAFERRGLRASLHVYEDRGVDDAVAADLAVHVFGSRAPDVRPDQPTLLWIISHPDWVTRQRCTGYAAIGVASRRFLADLQVWIGETGPRLVYLPQATDPSSFFPEPGGPPHELLFVGNSRGLRRPVLDHLSGTHHRLAIYGRGWTRELIEGHALTGEWIPNDELHRYYAAASIVLNDAYPDMREEGFISNRVHDALASGAFVVSERIPGIDAEFQDAVPTFTTRDELISLVDRYLAAPDERARLAAAGRRIVLERHTFDHRVTTILEAIDPGGSSTRSAGPGRDIATGSAVVR
jgi:glycosyltransferase involved in cell wall biosynthesis